MSTSVNTLLKAARNGSAGIAESNPNQKTQEVDEEFDARKTNAKFLEIKLSLKQLDLKERERNLVPVNVIQALLADTDPSLVALILDLPIRLAWLLPEGEQRKKILTESDLICRQMCRSHADHLRQQFAALRREQP